MLQLCKLSNTGLKPTCLVVRTILKHNTHLPPGDCPRLRFGHYKCTPTLRALQVYVLGAYYYYYYYYYATKQWRVTPSSECRSPVCDFGTVARHFLIWVTSLMICRWNEICLQYKLICMVRWLRSPVRTITKLTSCFLPVPKRCHVAHCLQACAEQSDVDWLIKWNEVKLKMIVKLKNKTVGLLNHFCIFCTWVCQ